MKYKLQGIKLKQLQGRSLSNVIITSSNSNTIINNHINSSQEKNESSPKNKSE